MLPAKFGSIWPSSFRGENCFNINQSETRIALGGHICWDEMKKLYRGPYIHLKSVTVGKIGLQKIQINHKNYNFTIDFGNCYGCK